MLARLSAAIIKFALAASKNIDKRKKALVVLSLSLLALVCNLFATTKH